MRWLAWLVAAVAVAFGVVGVVFTGLTRDLPDTDAAYALFSVGVFVISAVYAAVGARIAAQQPRNPVAWILLVIGLCQALGGAYDYGRWGYLVAASPPPLAAHALWLPQWSWAPSLGLLVTHLPLMLPNGRLPSRRWRPVAWLAAGGTALASGALALVVWRVRGPEILALSPEHGLPTAYWTGVGIVGCCSIAAVGALVRRYRRAAGVERQQLKWIAFGAAGTAVGIAAMFLVLAVSSLTLNSSIAVLSVGGLGMLALPLSIGVAVLRYRLYDIDRVVSRSVSYVLLTGVLAAIYLAAVLIGSRLLAPLAAGSELAVAAATLAAAAVFTPARRRIQTAVDRRFNRARYDAEQVVTAFRLQLRDEVDLAEVGDALVAAANRTVQPQAAALWLTSPASQQPRHTG